MMDRVTRPWGYYHDLERESNYVIKKLYIKPQSRISLQYHNHRDEVWTVIRGYGVAWKPGMFSGNKISCETIGIGDSIKISSNQIHRIENTSTEQDLVILEVQLGVICDEEDIVRLEDDYNRVDSLK